MCVKLTMPALILSLQRGVSGANKGGDRKADVERERETATACPICVRLTYSLRACVRVCRDYEAASEIENVPTARTLRHTPTKRRKTALPDSDFMNVWGGNTEGRRRILGLNVRVRERTHFFEVKIQIKLP